MLVVIINLREPRHQWGKVFVPTFVLNGLVDICCVLIIVGFLFLIFGLHVHSRWYFEGLAIYTITLQNVIANILYVWSGLQPPVILDVSESIEHSASILTLVHWRMAIWYSRLTWLALIDWGECLLIIKGQFGGDDVRIDLIEAGVYQVLLFFSLAAVTEVKLVSWLFCLSISLSIFIKFLFHIWLVYVAVAHPFHVVYLNFWIYILVLNCYHCVY